MQPQYTTVHYVYDRLLPLQLIFFRVQRSMFIGFLKQNNGTSLTLILYTMVHYVEVFPAVVYSVEISGASGSSVLHNGSLCI